MKALILNGKVVDLVETEFEVHPSMTWVDATDDAEVGGAWDGSVFTPNDTRTEAQKLEDMWVYFRSNRDKRLRETDVWALSDRTMSAEQTAYRQALRDLPANTTDPSNPVWPTKPGA